MHCARIVLKSVWQGKGLEKDKEIMMGFRKIPNKFFLDVQDQANIKKQLAHYKNMESIFANLITLLVAKEMPTHTRWNSYGFETQELQSFTIKVLSQVIVTSAYERNWNIFEFIHSKKVIGNFRKNCKFNIYT
jgi:hypothetical protein